MKKLHFSLREVGNKVRPGRYVTWGCRDVAQYVDKIENNLVYFKGTKGTIKLSSRVIIVDYHCGPTTLNNDFAELLTYNYYNYNA